MRGDGETDPDGEAGSAAVRDDGGRGRKPRLSDRTWAILIAAAVVVLDQLTKQWALAALEGEPRVVIIDNFLELTFTRNPGSAFSLFQGNGPILGIIALGVVGLIVFVLRDASHRLEALALGLVLGGALGNLTDRAFRGDGFLDGAVIDWVDLWWIPTFNVADAAITIGVGLLLVAAVVTRR